MAALALTVSGCGSSDASPDAPPTTASTPDPSPQYLSYQSKSEAIGKLMQYDFYRSDCSGTVGTDVVCRLFQDGSHSLTIGFGKGTTVDSAFEVSGRSRVEVTQKAQQAARVVPQSVGESAGAHPNA